MIKRILLTGATGLIGKRLTSMLKGMHELSVLGRGEPVPGVDWIACDLSEPLDTSILPGNVDAVVYLAQPQFFRDFPERANGIFEINVAKVQALLDWACKAGVRQFVLASSGGIYGHGNDAFREEDIVRPSGPLGYYLASKHCAELLTESYADHLCVAVLRFFFVYGPGQRAGMLIPRLIESVRTGRPVILQGQDGVRLNPIFVDDAATAVVRSLALTESHKINIAGSEVLSLRQLAERIGQVVGRAPVFEMQSDAEPRHLVGDTSRMERLLGTAAIALNEGLRRMVDAPVAGV